MDDKCMVTRTQQVFMAHLILKDHVLLLFWLRYRCCFCLDMFVLIRAFSLQESWKPADNSVEQWKRRTSLTSSKHVCLAHRRGLLCMGSCMMSNASPHWWMNSHICCIRKKKLHYFPFFCSSQSIGRLIIVNCKERQHLSATQACICAVGG